MIAVEEVFGEPIPMRVALTAFILSTAPPGIGLIAVDFETKIWPFVEKKCVECHKAPHEQNGRTQKPKAGLRLDGAWAWSAGSENGKIVESGKPDESEVYIRVTLPHDDDDFMPPTGEADPLTDREVKLFRKWIKEGADFGGWEGNLEGRPTETTSSKSKIPVSEIQELYSRLSEGLEKPAQESWESITNAGGRVQRLAPDSPLVSVDFRLTRDEATDEKIASVTVMAPHIADLDLSRTPLTDAGISVAKEMPRLVRLNLSQTDIGDDALDHLAELEELRYLNLYDTRVSDSGLQKLSNLANLESVYLWGSDVTPNGIRKLKKALPNANINFK